MNEMINRRWLLQATAALVVTFSSTPGASRAQPASAAKTVSPNRVDGFLAIDKDGNVVVYSGKVDLGTGVRTALTQIVAEELDVPMGHVTVIQGDTELTPDQGTTSGSLSIQNGGMQLRRAAATTRRALLEKAAAELRRDVSMLAIRNGFVIINTEPDGGPKLPFGMLVGGMSLALLFDSKAPLKAPADYTIVGKPVPRLDIPEKVSGRFTYMQDFKLSGMLHGRVIRPSGIGATLVSYDETSINHIPGVVKVVGINNFLGVVAETEWSATSAAAIVEPAAVELVYEAVDWTPGKGGRITEALYEGYGLQSIRIQGSKAHPTRLVQSAAMASVAPPKPSYRPHLPANLASDGLLSDAQLESIIYAGEAHSGCRRFGHVTAQLVRTPVGRIETSRPARRCRKPKVVPRALR